jgi:hypothetical protein
LDEVFDQLKTSSFRRRFHLGAAERRYITEKGFSAVLEHAGDFVATRLADAAPRNDGKQTPFKGHPVFVAQHATGTCCRGCLEKWHHIPRGQSLTDEQQAHAVAAIARWLRAEMAR